MNEENPQSLDYAQRHVVHLRAMTRMKLIALGALILACVFGFLTFKYLTRTPYAESINNFDTKMVVQKDGEILITESVVYDFGYNKKMGITRYIPLVSADSPKLVISAVSVEDEFGKLYKYEAFVEDDIFVIKIGDPDNLISGIQTYKIMYKVDNAVTNYSKLSEIYWNVTGDQWPAAVKSATTLITLPGREVDIIRTDCFTGPRGSKERSCRYEHTYTGESTDIFYSTNKPLMKIEGFTIILDFPLGVTN